MKHFFTFILGYNLKRNKSRKSSNKFADLELDFRSNSIMSLREKSNKTFWLHFYFNGNGDEWLEYGLPIPSYIRHSNYGYFIAWEIDGFFGTKQGTEYLNDMIARIIFTFKDLKPQRLDYKPTQDKNSHNYNKKYTLADLQNLKSLSKKRFAPRRADSFSDNIFWSIKLYTEDLIREYQEGTPVPYSQIESFAFSNFLKQKDNSTIKAKCRSVWNWYDKNGWTISKRIKVRKTKTNEELKKVRQTNASINSKNIQNKTRQLVIDAITGEYPKEYKKKSGAWHIKIISESIKVNTKTVSKYIKELENKLL